MPGTTHHGTIVRLHPNKPFGFIEGPGAKEYFFHAGTLCGAAWEDLTVGQHVDFDGEINSPKGPRCLRVVIASAP